MKPLHSALKGFIPYPYLTPGSMNLIRFKNFRLIIDTHNRDGSAFAGKTVPFKLKRKKDGNICNKCKSEKRKNK